MHGSRLFPCPPVLFSVLIILFFIMMTAPGCRSKKVKVEAEYVRPSSSYDQDSLYERKKASGWHTEITDLSAVPISLGEGVEEPLAALAERVFAAQREMTEKLWDTEGLVGTVILNRPVEVVDALNFKYSVLLHMSTVISVLDPALLRSVWPEYDTFMSSQGEGRIPVAELSAESRDGLRRYKLQALRFAPENPLRIAAEQGDQALLDAVVAGKGEFKIEDTVVIPKTHLPRQNGRAAFPAVEGDLLNYNRPRLVDGPVNQIRTFGSEEASSLGEIKSPASRTLLPQIRLVCAPFCKDPGQKDYLPSKSERLEFLAGFSLGHSMEWERRVAFASGYLSASMSAGCGIGLRIPIQVTVLVPETCDLSGKSVESSVSVDVFDAESDFYKAAGLASSQCFRGNEFVLEMDAVCRVRAVELWQLLGAQERVGIGFNHSATMTPPFGDNKKGLPIKIDPVLTNTKFTLSAVSAALVLGMNVGGDGRVKLDIANTCDEAEKTSVTFENPKDRQSYPLLLEADRNPSCSIANVRYEADLTITPMVRLEASASLLMFSRKLETDWWMLNECKVKAGKLYLGAHKGTARVKRQEFKRSPLPTLPAKRPQTI